MNVKAIIFDLDGTAIPNKPGGMPSERLVQAIESAQNKLELCAATGRPITNAAPILQSLGLTNPCVISAGTQIVDPQTHEIIWEVLIDSQSVEKIISVCSDEKCEAEIIANNELMGEGSTAQGFDFNRSINVLYIMQVGRDKADSLIEQLHEIPNITVSPVLSWGGKGVDIHITNKIATKEHAVEELLKIIKVEKENVVGIGDADNDVHLFKSVGYKIAMGNATDKLKSLADEIVDSVDNDGLAEVIQKYGKN